MPTWAAPMPYTNVYIVTSTKLWLFFKPEERYVVGVPLCVVLRVYHDLGYAVSLEK